jgi:hypothetical protein
MEMMELDRGKNEGGNVEDIRGNRWIRASLTVTVLSL